MSNIPIDSGGERPTLSGRSLIARMVRAARLDVRLYEEVEADTSATGQALSVVLLSSLAAGIGAVGGGMPGGLLMNMVAALAGWVIWAWLTYVIGTRLLAGPQTEADVGQLLRTTGFSSAPGVIRVAGILPSAGTLIFSIAAVWMLVAMVIAIRQALDYESTGRAVVVCLIGWTVQVGIVWAMWFLLGRPFPT